MKQDGIVGPLVTFNDSLIIFRFTIVGPLVTFNDSLIIFRFTIVGPLLGYL